MSTFGENTRVKFKKNTDLSKKRGFAWRERERERWKKDSSTNWCMCMYNSTVSSRFYTLLSLGSIAWYWSLCTPFLHDNFISSSSSSFILPMMVLGDGDAVTIAVVVAATFVCINIAWIIVSFCTHKKCVGEWAENGFASIVVVVVIIAGTHDDAAVAVT